MKKIVYIIIVLCMVAGISASCDEPEDLTPKVESVTDDYLVPKGSILTEQDRQEIMKKVDEYNEAING